MTSTSSACDSDSVLQIRYLPSPINCGSLFQASSQAVVEKWQIFVTPLLLWFRDMHENTVLTLVGFCVVLLATKSIWGRMAPARLRASLG